VGFALEACARHRGAACGEPRTTGNHFGAVEEALIRLDSALIGLFLFRFCLILFF
jgi:hypothetical protein